MLKVDGLKEHLNEVLLIEGIQYLDILSSLVGGQYLPILVIFIVIHHPLVHLDSLLRKDA